MGPWLIHVDTKIHLQAKISFEFIISPELCASRKSPKDFLKWCQPHTQRMFPAEWWLVCWLPWCWANVNFHGGKLKEMSAYKRPRSMVLFWKLILITYIFSMMSSAHFIHTVSACWNSILASGWTWCPDSHWTHIGPQSFYDLLP